MSFFDKVDEAQLQSLIYRDYLESLRDGTSDLFTSSIEADYLYYTPLTQEDLDFSKKPKKKGDYEDRIL